MLAAGSAGGGCVVDSGRFVDTLTALQQAPGKRVAAIACGEFAIRDHPPQTGAGRTGADAEQGGHRNQLRDRETRLV